MLAQSLLYALARGAADAAEGVFFDVMIDNVRFVSDDPDALAVVWVTFLTNCRYVGVTMGDTTPPTSEEYDHLGMHVTAERTVTLTSNFATKLERATHSIVRSTTSTWRDIQSAFGKLMYGLMTVGISLGRAYFVFKYVRRRSRAGLGKLDTTTVWQRVKDEWSELANDAKRAEFTFWGPTDYECSVYSDASSEGWGVVIFGLHNPVSVFGARWRDDEVNAHINVNEARAFRIALRWIAWIKRDEPLKVTAYIDNTTALAAARNGRSRAFTTNLIATTCSDLCAEHNIILDGPHWVPSRFNYADIPSREDDMEGATRAGHPGHTAP
jgi:hypothetical protein